MATLSLSSPFKKIIPEEVHRVKAKNLAELCQWLQVNLPILSPILFDSESTELKSFICILHNNVQIESSNLSHLLQPDDTIELILPMSGG